MSRLNVITRNLVIVAAMTLSAAGPALAESSVPKPDQVAACAACHGEIGVSTSPIFPNLAGQHRDYLLKALTEYKSGVRKNPIMAAQVVALKPADMKALALWFSSQKAVLYTVDPEGEHAPKAAAKAAEPEKKG